MTLAYIGIGSNLGDREGTLNAAIGRLAEDSNVAVTKRSGFYETTPDGGPPQPDFLNGVVEIDTLLTPDALLVRLHAIEESLERKRVIKWGARTIDMDIVLYGDLVMDKPCLKIPHPLMHTRRFVLDPLSEIAPSALHPVIGKTIVDLRDALNAGG